MNGYQRIMTAMNLGMPDRVPISEFIIDPHVFRYFFPQAENQTVLEEGWDLDTVSCGVKFFPVKETSDGMYKDEWGVLYARNNEMIDHPVKGPVASRKDLDTYRPPEPAHPGRLGRLKELVTRYKDKKAVVFHQRAAFMWSCYLMGMDNMLMNFVINPQLCHDIMDMVLECNIEIARMAIQAGADIIVLGDDYAHNKGPLMSPQMFNEFVMPRLARMVDVIHTEGGLVVKHSDGNIMKILNDIVETGIDALNPIEPSAGMDLKEIKHQYGDKVCLWGNVDCSSLLCYGTIEEVRCAVVSCINAAASNGGYVLTSSNSIHSSLNPENYQTMVLTAKEFGLII